MKITIEPDLPGEPAEKEVAQHVTAYVIGYKEGRLVSGPGHQAIFPTIKVLGVTPSTLRVGLLEISDHVLLQMLRGDGRRGVD